ncbi:hypothetical protein OHB54_02505 [Streptomyces sp. NBC_01007]|nr:hypothetical protein OHB54_02505 [Streptomyces sp. NBC_01007]
MLTDWARGDDHRFAVAAQWPRGHSFFTAVDGCHDPLIALETIRQTGLPLTHAEYGVPSAITSSSARSAWPSAPRTCASPRPPPHSNPTSPAGT